jgi:hypothetical protein
MRSGSYLPYAGIIALDTADLSMLETEGDLLDVFTHEIGHVLGFGTIWNLKGLLVGAGTSNPTFTGAQARAEYNSLFGTSAAGVPVEAGGGQGTALAHWRDSIFQTELMTGWSKPGSSPISRITVASMADLGYQVNMAAAEAYARPGSVRTAASLAAATSAPPAGGNLRYQMAAARPATLGPLSTPEAARTATPETPHVAAALLADSLDPTGRQRAVDQALESDWNDDLFASLARDHRSRTVRASASDPSATLESLEEWMAQV